MGVAGFDLANPRRMPFPSGAQPLHPAVIAYFGLTYAHPGQAYPLNEEGFFDFEAFCRRYMRFEWNETLHRGIQTAKTRPEDAVADLEAGLAVSPYSVLGRQALAVARHAAGLEQGPAPDFVIDEESYDNAALAAAQPAAAAEQSVDVAPAAEERAPEPALVAEEEPEPEPYELTLPVEDAPPTDEPVEELNEPDDAPPVGYAGILRRPAPAPDAWDDQPIEHGFTNFDELRSQAGSMLVPVETEASFIDVLPRMLPGFADIAAAASDRPFNIMPETMPPPPLRPILPPEMQGEPERPGLISRLLGRRVQ
jgi:hypothetical protein